MTLTLIPQRVIVIANHPSADMNRISTIDNYIADRDSAVECELIIDEFISIVATMRSPDLRMFRRIRLDQYP